MSANQSFTAYFTGRTKGAIGIFYPIATHVEAPDGAAVHLKLYDEYEHIQGLRLITHERRYVATYLRADGMRTLMSAAQGRHTFDTPEDAQAWIDAVFTNAHNSPETLRSIWGEDPRPEVRPAWCWPGHFDPIGVYFD